MIGLARRVVLVPVLFEFGDGFLRAHAHVGHLLRDIEDRFRDVHPVQFRDLDIGLVEAETIFQIFGEALIRTTGGFLAGPVTHDGVGVGVRPAIIFRGNDVANLRREQQLGAILLRFRYKQEHFLSYLIPFNKLIRTIAVEK